MSRIGRSQPIQPTVWHGPDDSVQADVPAPVVVPLDADRHHLRPALAPVVAAHGFIDSGVGVPGTTPPLPVSLDRADQRARFLPLASISLSGVLAGLVAPPAATPPAAYVVPLDERRRFLAALPPDFNVGFDDVVPPGPKVVEPDDWRHRRPPLDPFTTTPDAAAAAPAPASPPPPFVVPIDSRGRFLVVLPTTGQHGFVDPGPGPVGTTPPPALNVDRPKLDPRYVPLQPVSASGNNAPQPSGDNPTGGSFDVNYFLTIHP